LTWRELSKSESLLSETGLSIDTIRFYEKARLNAVLRRAPKADSGFRLFQEKDIENLRLIRSGQSLGFSLDEIRELLSVRNGMSAPSSEVKLLLEQKLHSVMNNPRANWIDAGHANHAINKIEGVPLNLASAQLPGQCDDRPTVSSK
jgi:DNA-binding transcriptional MerR regulator